MTNRGTEGEEEARAAFRAAHEASWKSQPEDDQMDLGNDPSKALIDKVDFGMPSNFHFPLLFTKVLNSNSEN